ncbi:hypothetical protein J1C56_27370 [Aminobacter anthyllidis]|uniref:Uncharacterized protein n=1 Tax=Aminobacter anthyllidis TaxID=1035067 RepID=A0A9X1D8N5_9HYPH|nr:hypothetical protein [Aminobacter anthyllidis]MBT1159301.1 hypothetical protein [Aminobacter anthyllidis]
MKKHRGSKCEDLPEGEFAAGLAAGAPFQKRLAMIVVPAIRNLFGKTVSATEGEMPELRHKGVDAAIPDQKLRSLL